MKTILLILLFAAMAFAHDHIDAGVDPDDETRLALEGPSVQVATYFPPGETVSFYSPNFPGGTFANEVTFSVEGEGDLEIPDPPSRVAVEIFSVEGPEEGFFSFWEVDATEPTLTFQTGWTADPDDPQRFEISEPGGAYGHIHGRLFTFSQPGEYKVQFRAVDLSGNLEPSAPHSVLFRVLAPPPLSLQPNPDGSVTLLFESRVGLTYDVQKTNDLVSNEWETLGWPISGDGQGKEETDSQPGNPVFYRIVEFQ